MEKRLEEFRKRKRKNLEAAPSSFTVSSSPKRSHFLLTWFRNKLEQLHESQLFKSISTKLSRIPVIGNPLVLKIILWLILFGLFLELEFGIVYVVLSLFVLIYINTSTKKRSKNKLSAYSVFNKNYETLDGTFTAEQFEKELTHRM